MSIDAQDDLAKFRRARDGSTEESKDSPEIFTCPIEGCSRTIIDDSGALRNHVTQETDDTHAGIELDDDLNPVEIGDRSNEDHDSIYDPGDPWGPGVPESEV